MIAFGVTEGLKGYVDSMARLRIALDSKTFSVITKAIRTGSMTSGEKRELNRLLREHCDPSQHQNKRREEIVRSEVTMDENFQIMAVCDDFDDHLENIFECIRPRKGVRKGLNLPTELVVDMMRGYLLNGE